MANLLSAHRDLGERRAPRRGRARCGASTTCRRAPGKTAVEMFEAVADGEIKVLWIACTNPAQSMPDQATVRRALERAEFVVVQEAFATTETAPTPTCCCRRRPGARRTAPSPTPSGASRACARRSRAPGEARARLADRGRLRAPPRAAPRSRSRARRADAVPLRDGRGGVERAPRDDARPRPRHHRPRATRMLDAAARSSGPVPTGARRRPRAPLRRRPASRPPTAARASSTRPTRRRPSRAMRAIRSRSTPGACATSGTA